MSEKLTATDLRNLKTRDEWAEYFIKNDPYRTRIDMAKDFNTDKHALRRIYSALYEDEEIREKYNLPEMKQGRKKRDKFKGD